MTGPPPSRQAQRFVDWLLQNQQDRGVMANLRRGFSPATEHYAWPHLAQFCPLDDDRQRMIYTVVAACFAFHPLDTSEGNLGTTLRSIAHSQAAGEDPLATYESRFRRLITASTVDEVCQQLRPIVQAAKARMVPINYGRLLDDLLRWDFASRDVKVQWAAEYFGRPPQEEILEETSAEEDLPTAVTQ
jgi:CRISPR system Cascade subunit CasB